MLEVQAGKPVGEHTLRSPTWRKTLSRDREGAEGYAHRSLTVAAQIRSDASYAGFGKRNEAGQVQ
jgi:hypothetical protein